MKIAPHIDRFGDIRKMLVDYFGNLLNKDDILKKAFSKALKEEYGNPVVIESKEELNEFTDNFVYSFKFLDGSTVTDRFVSEVSGISKEEKPIVLSWKEPVAGIFQVKKVLTDGLVAENLINEVEYIIKPTTIPQRFERHAQPGAFFRAKIVPASSTEYIFSGIQQFFDVSSEDEILKAVASLQMEHPEFAFRDNEKRLKQGFEMQEKDRTLFIEYFGSDEVLTEGRKLDELMAGFMDYRLKKNEKPIPVGYRPPKMTLPSELIRSRDVGIVFDEIGGQCFLINYGLILDIFQNPDDCKIERHKDEIMTYLEHDSISPIVLRRIFFRFPQNAELIIRKVLNRPEFELERDFESLMEELKPSFKGRRILPQMLPMSPRMVRSLRPEIYQQESDTSKIGRNAPCACGSGKKYKRCCGK